MAELKNIQVAGREVPCRLTMGAFRRFKRATDRDASKMEDTIDDQLTFLWCCVSSACNADGVEFNLTLDDFADHLEPAALNAYIAALNEGADGEEQKKTEARI